MPELAFPHHNYQYPVDQGHHEFVSSETAQGIEDPQPADLPGLPEKLRDANVAEVVLIHGTFAGDDVSGLTRQLGRILPGAAQSMKSLQKRVFDQVAGDIGNYTKGFAEKLSAIVNHQQKDPIPVERFLWSGENHHIGRASGAITLLSELLQEDWNPNQRMLVLAHSHGGNVLALLLNLVHCETRLVEQFFDATQSHYRDPVLGRLTLPIWEQMRDELKKEDVVNRLPQMDIATFGTPCRYRWPADTEKLIHFVQHRVQDEAEPTKACLPKSISDLTSAAGGDYIQQLGIGGTDFFHSVVAWQSWRSERRLRSMLEPNVRRRDLAKNLIRGHRISLDGKTLLVDYPPAPGEWNASVLGHGIYTRQEWLPFHLNEIAARFYS